MALKGFASLFRLAARERNVPQDVEEEIETHLALLADSLVAKGWNREAAREEAIRRFGDRSRVRRELRSIDRSLVRRRRLAEGLDSWRQDLVVAWRGLRRSPGYAAVVVGTLGVALGANGVMFGVIDRLLLRAPPGIVAPDEVKRVHVARWFEDHLSEPWDAISYPSFEGLRDGGTGFSHVAAVGSGRLSLGLGPAARQVEVTFASGQYFDLLGVVPFLGRLFHEADDRPPRGTPVAVASWRFWRDGLGGDPGIVGTTITLNGRPFEVIGVADRAFRGADLSPVDLWLPLSTIEPIAQRTGDWRTARGWQWLNAIVRLEPRVSEADALAAATRGYQSVNADFAPMEHRAVPRLRPIQAYSEDESGNRIAIWLYGVTVVVLLIACANVANVVLARGTVRRTETAVRQALGVARGRLMRQFLVETTLVTSLGLGLGLLLTRFAGLLVRRILLADTVWDASPVNGRVLVATALAATVAAILASLWPLVRSARMDLAAELHGTARTAGGRSDRARRGLLLIQATLSTLLVILAGLFLRSLAKVEGLDVGMETRRTVLVSVELGGLGVPDHEIAAFYRRAAERVRTVPGVAAAGVTQTAPFMANRGGLVIVPGRDSIPRLPGGGPYWFAVGPGALEAYGVRLLRGRTFTEHDRRDSPPVVVVGRRMAETIWPGENVLGKCFKVGADSMPCREIVGVAADVNRQEMDEAPFFMFFSVLEQEPGDRLPRYLVVQTAPGAVGVDATIRRVLTEARADLPYVQILPYRDILAQHARPWRLGAALLAVFAALSLLIAAIGLYGVVAFAVSQRTRELGLRSALGASPGRLLRAVVSSGVATAAAGALLGSGLAVVLAPRVEPLLFRTRAADPTVFLLAALAVVAVSLAAALVPARRAVRLDPTEALRAE